MNILILGGSTFIGQNFVRSAERLGAHLTFFNRGSTRQLFPEHETLRGDRTGDWSALTEAVRAGRRWDVAFDHFAYGPEHVTSVLDVLAPAVDRYALISTSSVYRDFGSGPVNETAPRLTISDAACERALRALPARSEPGRGLGPAFGPIKARLEDALIAALPGRALIVRPGFLAGPHDYLTHYGARLPHWLRRAERGGDMLAPGRPDDRVRLLDVRDLTDWVAGALLSGVTGTFNVSGQDGLTMGNLLDACVRATGGRARLQWRPSAELLRRADVEFRVTDLPFWLPDTLNRFYDLDDTKARAMGLTYRPLEHTVRDTADWLRASCAEREVFAGLSAPAETRLLGLGA